MPNSKNWLSILCCILIGCLVTTVIPVYAFIFDRSPEPSSVQINLTEVGAIADFKFDVRKHFHYSYSMRFGFPENDQVERARVRKLLGGHGVDKTGKPLEPGIPTPINLTIFAICKDGKEVEVYSQDANPILTSWGQDSFGKDIGSHILTPGIYRVRLVNKRASLEFSSIPITFEIGMPAKVNFDSTKEPKRSKPCQQ
jgi:hypothetical protein